MAALRALIAGSSGLVGRACLDTLVAHPAYGRIVAFVRRPAGRTAPTLVERVMALDRLDDEPAEPVDHAFCALGTTIRAAGSQEAFRRVDLEMVRSFAVFARRSGASAFVLVSSVGADPRSRNFYLRVKGEAERTIMDLGFAGVYVLRPGVLIGARTEVRRGEALAQRLAPVLSLALQGPLRKYRGISAATVGAAMVGAARAGRPGTTVLHYEGIRGAAARAAR